MSWWYPPLAPGAPAEALPPGAASTALPLPRRAAFSILTIATTLLSSTLAPPAAAAPMGRASTALPPAPRVALSVLLVPVPPVPEPQDPPPGRSETALPRTARPLPPTWLHAPIPAAPVAELPAGRAEVSLPRVPRPLPPTWLHAPVPAAPESLPPGRADTALAPRVARPLPPTWSQSPTPPAAAGTPSVGAWLALPPRRSFWPVPAVQGAVGLLARPVGASVVDVPARRPARLVGDVWPALRVEPGGAPGRGVVVEVPRRRGLPAAAEVSGVPLVLRLVAIGAPMGRGETRVPAPRRVPPWPPGDPARALWLEQFIGPAPDAVTVVVASTWVRARNVAAARPGVVTVATWVRARNIGAVRPGAAASSAWPRVTVVVA